MAKIYANVLLDRFTNVARYAKWVPGLALVLILWWTCQNRLYPWSLACICISLLSLLVRSPSLLVVYPHSCWLYTYIIVVASYVSPIQGFADVCGRSSSRVSSSLIPHILIWVGWGWVSICPFWVYSTNWLDLSWLVVYLPLWKIWVRQLGWWHSQCMEKYSKSHVPNHQPVSNLYETYGDIWFSATQWLDPKPHPRSWPLSAGRSSSVKRSITWGLALRWASKKIPTPRCPFFATIWSTQVITIGKTHHLNDPQQKVAILQLGIIESVSISIQIAELSHEHPSFSTKSQTCDSRMSCSMFFPIVGWSPTMDYWTHHFSVTSWCTKHPRGSHHFAWSPGVGSAAASAPDPPQNGPRERCHCCRRRGSGSLTALALGWWVFYVFFRVKCSRRPRC